MVLPAMNLIIGNKITIVLIVYILVSVLTMQTINNQNYSLIILLIKSLFPGSSALITSPSPRPNFLRSSSLRYTVVTASANNIFRLTQLIPQSTQSIVHPQRWQAKSISSPQILFPPKVILLPSPFILLIRVFISRSASIPKYRMNSSILSLERIIVKMVAKSSTDASS